MRAASPYEIVINPPEIRQVDFRQYLFNQPYFLQKQLCKQIDTFYLVHKNTQQAHATFILSIQDGRGFSPCRGPFGSVEMNPLLPIQDLDDFIEHINTFAAAQGISQLEIKSYPFCYSPEVSAVITNSLLRQQYHILYTDLNYHIPVTQTGLADKLHLSAKRRLQKCITAGFDFGEEQAPDLPLIYQLIVDSRQQKGYPVTMTFSDFRQLFEDFPGSYKIFSIRDKQRIVAATVAVKINQHILYYFLPAHDPVYNTYSPMVLLIQGLYNYCQSAGYSILDLGISTDKGIPNHGLMRFKNNMGACVSLKLSFIKRFIP